MEEKAKPRILFPIPSTDFDPTEAAVSWWYLKKQGFLTTFATPDGKRGYADEMMLTGEGLDLWSRVPLLGQLCVVGLILRASQDARDCYAAMEASEEFLHPIRWEDVRPEDYDGLILPGGHRARGMRAYLESPALQAHVASFFRASKPVGAICHGVLLAARSPDPSTGKSVLWGKQTTALPWAFESSADSLAGTTRFWDPHYYRTYLETPDQPRGYMSVQQEVTRLLAQSSDFVDVPPGSEDYSKKTSGLHRDTLTDWSPSFVVVDGNYVSARWPGDVYKFAATFCSLFK
eukprot:TRINITY_DN13360_c0_g1_i4.p1 TRINITY_DN13360_c0_g1~~TRINITY_DN13360_c0_g1_i4.p1  ORF type:complete len:290 (-),score=51.59 TRINITY_DN13360_c0_g1_i4:47-916(-)